VNRSAKIFRRHVGSSQKNRRAQTRNRTVNLRQGQIQCGLSIPRVPPSTRHSTDRAHRTERARNNAQHHRAIWLDRQAGHTPAVTPDKQLVDVHRGLSPPATRATQCGLAQPTGPSPNLPMSRIRAGH
jgi:hypothetical protein